MIENAHLYDRVADLVELEPFDEIDLDDVARVTLQ